jgi:hypothetical protein
MKTIADHHQELICRDTVRNPAKGDFLWGGPTAEQAEQILREKFNYTDKKIDVLKNIEDLRIRFVCRPLDRKSSTLNPEP